MRMSWVNHFLRLEEEAVSSSLLLIPTIWFEWTVPLISVNWSRSLKMYKFIVSKECWRDNMCVPKYVFIYIFCRTIALDQLTLWLLYCLWRYRREQTAWLRLVEEKEVGSGIFPIQYLHLSGLVYCGAVPQVTFWILFSGCLAAE